MSTKSREVIWGARIMGAGAQGAREDAQRAVREAIDRFGVLFAVTPFFCLLNSAYDGIVTETGSSIRSGGGTRSIS